MTDLTIDIGATLDFLVGLLEIPSPTGYHHEAIAYTQQAFETLNFPEVSLSITRKGALLAYIKGEKDDAPIGITAHADTLGFMVKEIKKNGGPRDPRVLEAVVDMFYMRNLEYPHKSTGDRWYGPSSAHTAVIQHGFADGHGKAISEDIDPALYLHLVTRAGDEHLAGEF